MLRPFCWQWLVREMAVQHRPVRAFGDEIRSYISVCDVASVISRVVQDICLVADTAPLRQLFVVGGPAALSRVDIAEAVHMYLQSVLTLDKAVVVQAIRRADAGLSYDAPLNATLASGKLEAYMGRPMVNVIADVLPAACASILTALSIPHADAS
jgi:dTDP-4-dehydrorhamnose reductase